MKRYSRIVRSLVGFAFLLTLCLLLCGHALAEGTCGASADWAFDEATGALTISGTGAMTNYYYYEKEDRYDEPSHYTYPWRSYTAAIRSISVGEGITSIGNCAFANLYNATSCSLPSTLKSIGASAFEGCGVTELQLPSKLTSIGVGAFRESRITEINLPSGITVIPNSAFGSCGITSIDLPAGLTDIDDFAFYGSSLASVTLPGGLKRIGDQAFAGTSLTSVALPGSLESLGSRAFPETAAIEYPTEIPNGTDGPISWSVVGGLLRLSGTGDMPDYEWVYSAGTTSYCTAPWYAHRSEIRSLVVESGVTSLGTHAFYKMNISTVSLPGTLKTISNYALMCNGLTSVTVPSSVTSVGYAFKSDTQVIGLLANGTDGDTAWRIENGELRISGNGGMTDYSIRSTGGRYSTSYADTPWRLYQGKITSIVIESGVTSIGRNAFYDCYNAASVTIPESVVSIGSDAFYKCGSVTEVDHWTSKASSWPRISFENCYANPMAYSGKAQLYLNGSLFGGVPALQGDVSAYAFYNCTNSFTVAASGGKISSVGDYAFYNCTGLTEAGMPSSLTHVGVAAFKNCTSLSYTYMLFNGLTYIGDGAFMGCTALTSADMKVDMDSAITYFGKNAFTGCTALKTVNLGNTGVLPDSTFWGCTALESVTLPETLAELQGQAFYDCTSLKTINLPASLKTIGHGAFMNCSAIKSIVFPDSMDSIGSYAFENCSALQSISFPKSVYVICECAFKGCPVLRSISFRGSAPTIITNAAFTGVTATVTYRPGSSWVNEQKNYGGTLTWSPLGGSCGDALWRLTEDGVLSITGSGTVQAGAWSAYADDIHQILIGDGITAIESRAFAGLPQVAKVSFAGTTTQIAADAFAGVTADVDWEESCTAMRDMCEAFDAPYAEGFGGTLNWRHPMCSITLDSRTYALVVNTHNLSNREASDPTCLAPGNAAYWSCTRCNLCFADEQAQQIAQADSFILPALGHSYSDPIFGWAEDGSSCSVAFTCARCNDVQSPTASISSKKVKDPDCVNPGETEYTASVEFGTEEKQDPENPENTISVPKVYTDKLTLEDIPALGHSESVTIEELKPTCTEPGHTQQTACSVCGLVLSASKPVDAKGHDEIVTIEAQDPTCTVPGYTQQTECSVCKAVLSESKPVGAKGHAEIVTIEAQAPRCTEPGHTQQTECSVCKQVLVPATPVPALGHTTVIDKAVPPTYLTTGLTEGSHCSVCEAVLQPQSVVPMVETPPMLALPKLLTAIEEEAFAGDTFVCVVLPDGCQRIEAGAFRGCTQLQYIEILASVTAISDTAFEGCSDQLIVITTAGSAAEAFAQKHEISCVLR